MTCCLDWHFEHWWLILKVLLLWKKLCHAAVLACQRTQGSTWPSTQRHSRESLRPLALPLGVIISCLSPQNQGSGFDWGMMVFFCLHCAPPFDLFMLKALSASGRSEAWAEDWSKMNNAWHPGWAASKISIADFIWTMSWSVSHHGSPLLPGKMTFWASRTIFPCSSNTTNRPFSSLINSETWINRPRPFLRSGCSPALNLALMSAIRSSNSLWSTHHRFHASSLAWKQHSSW